MYPLLEQYVKSALIRADVIDEERMHALEEIARFVSAERRTDCGAKLHFICTHNSRRSQMGQIWAATAAARFHVDGVRTYSGGTEATAFDVRAVGAIERAGFAVDVSGDANPRYSVRYADDRPPIECFSKTYDDPANPTERFAAIMTCAEADAACPVVHGAAMRFPIRYEDPKVADGTVHEARVYDERCSQIATEMLYLFSRVE